MSEKPNNPLLWSALDQERFGLKTAKIIITNPGISITKLLNEFRNEKGELLIARCDSKLTNTIIELQKEGFFLTDTMLTFSIKDFSKPSEKNNNNIEIAPANDNEGDILAEIGEKSFKNYRGHYHNNPYLDNDKCSEVYIDWAGKLCTVKAMADAVFIARVNGKPAGFASLKVIDNGIARAGLLGVVPEFEGMGISKLLHHHRFSWCKANQIAELQVETSLNNTKYVNNLIKMGFRFNYSTQILHFITE